MGVVEPLMNAQKLLESYLRAEPGSDDLQREALSSYVRSLVQRALAKREISDLEDFEEECVLMIWTRISALKSGEASGEIENFEGFIRQAVHNRYCDAIRRKRPKWYSLKLELLEIFTGRAGIRGLAAWQHPESSGRLLGYAEWEGLRGTGTAKCRALADNSELFRARFLANRDPSELPLYELAAAVLDYCGGPVDADTLTSCLADLLQARREEPLSIDAQPDVDGDAGAPIEWLISPDAPVEQQVVDACWFENVVEWFWGEFCQLTLKQKKTLVYGMSREQVMALAGVVAVGKMAEALEMSVSDFARLVKSLPLPDSVTAQELGIEARAVPSVRFKAWGRIRRRTRKSALSFED